MDILATIILVFLVHQYNKHYMETKDSSLQGFFEYLKNKYWTKKEP